MKMRVVRPSLLGLMALGWVSGSVLVAATNAPPPYRAGDLVTTNFAVQNRFLWTNANGQVLTPSNTLIHLRDFEGRIVFFCFFDVW
ncbi:MAG TPA: hypothetical protein VEO53_15990 [Candidatus Binatia bacterium]|nr:hypothetical protein [Candidatus Binatia bacterium]